MYPMFPIYGTMFPNLFKLKDDYPEPPTVYSILNSYVNFANDTPAKIKDLAKTGRAVFFDFEYPLTDNISKEDFECMILNKFMMRRIAYETVTAFKLQLNVKLNEIMPVYNKLFDALDGWEIFNDGETITRTNNVNRSGTDINSSTNSVNTSDSVTNSSTSDQRNSDTPQNALSDVTSGQYVTDYRKISDSGSTTGSSQSSGSSSSTTNTSGTEATTETINRTPADKIRIYKEFIENRKGIYTMIFEDLEDLFYKIY